jgi:acetyl-CoA carboxylase carboxyltransferase component
VLAAIRAELPSTTPDEPFAVVGPATMVSTLIAGAARDAADTLAESLRSSARPSPATHSTLRELAIAARAWVETYIDCRSLEWYCFDADFELPPEL